jgi:hypothetical protein
MQELSTHAFHKAECLKPLLFCCVDLDTAYSILWHPSFPSLHQNIHCLAGSCCSRTTCHVRYTRRLCPKISSCSFDLTSCLSTPHRIALFVKTILRGVREAAMLKAIACSEPLEKHFYPMPIGQSSVLFGRDRHRLV